MVQTIAVIGAGPVGRGIAQLAARVATARSWKTCCPTRCAGRRAKFAFNLTGRWTQAGLRLMPPFWLFPVWSLPALSKTLPARPTWSSRRFRKSWNRRSRSSPCSTRSAVPAPSSLPISRLLASPRFPASPIAPGIVWVCASRNPVDRENRLEIIRGRETDDDTLATAVEVGRRMGKETVVIEDPASGPT